ncbi:hypothetical protein ACFTY7_39140, partial [Streptomyces sp. NPDC057062]
PRECFFSENTVKTRSTFFFACPRGSPAARCPDITQARGKLGWEPEVDTEDGLRRTIEWFRTFLGR